MLRSLVERGGFRCEATGRVVASPTQEPATDAWAPFHYLVEMMTSALDITARFADANEALKAPNWSVVGSLAQTNRAETLLKLHWAAIDSPQRFQCSLGLAPRDAPFEDSRC